MVSTITLQNFRSYSQHIFEISETTTLITGKNGTGKTNLLEAIAVLCNGKSFRSNDEELIAKSQEWCRIDGVVDGHTRNIKIKREYDSIQKTYEIDNILYKRLSEKTTFPTVIFEPNQLLLFFLGPENRRDYFDTVLEQISPLYKKTLRDYRRVLAHRNTLLKRAREQQSVDFFVWDIRLSELAGKIVAQRQELISSINIALTELYQYISESDQRAVMSYGSSIEQHSYESSLLQKLTINNTIDIQRGYTTVGPHRDDFVVHIDGHMLQSVASRGESRTVVISLKLIETELKERIKQKKPILLLDDVFGELDSIRRRALFSKLENYQTIITATDADTLPFKNKQYNQIEL